MSKNTGKPITLNPLGFNEAIRDLLKVKPEPKSPTKGKGAPASPQKKAKEIPKA